MTLIAWPFVTLARLAGQAGINAEPAKGHAIPLDAAPLPPTSQHYLPRARRLGEDSEAFDQGIDTPSDYLNADRTRDDNDPYGQHLDSISPAARPKGNAETESELRYEMLAQLRMRADRDKRDRTQANRPFEETDEEWQAWSHKQTTDLLKSSADVAATDHSTIMTHPLNAEHVLAYDVAAGVSKLTATQWNALRVAADWRLLPELETKGDPFGRFAEYFEKGTLNGKPLSDFANFGEESRIPSKIINERTTPSRPQSPRNDYVIQRSA